MLSLFIGFPDKSKEGKEGGGGQTTPNYWPPVPSRRRKWAQLFTRAVTLEGELIPRRGVAQGIEGTIERDLHADRFPSQSDAMCALASIFRSFICKVW